MSADKSLMEVLQKRQPTPVLRYFLAIDYYILYSLLEIIYVSTSARLVGTYRKARGDDDDVEILIVLCCESSRIAIVSWPALRVRDFGAKSK